MGIRQMTSAEVLKETWLSTYNQEMFPIATQLTQLNCNLHIMKKIASFPFTELGEIVNDFWYLTCASMFETNVMIVWRLVDPKKNVHSISNLRSKIANNLKNDGLRVEFEALTEKAEFDTKVVDIREKVKVIRHNRFAHSQITWIVKQEPLLIDEDSLPISDLEAMASTLSDLYDLLCFGEKRSLYLRDYDPNVMHPGKAHRSDIERVLDSVAKDSSLVNMPERDIAWPYLKKLLDPSELRIMLHFRKKFGLSDV